jgi:hypothetical protein
MWCRKLCGAGNSNENVNRQLNPKRAGCIKCFLWSCKSRTICRAPAPSGSPIYRDRELHVPVAGDWTDEGDEKDAEVLYSYGWFSEYHI